MECGLEKLEQLGGKDWAQRGTRSVCMSVLAGVISTKSVPYDTHSHGLCLDSFSLFCLFWCLHLSFSVSLPLPLSVCHFPGCAMKGKGFDVGCRGGEGAGYFSASTGAL